MKKKASTRKGSSATAGFYERAFGVLKGGGLTQALEESRRKEKKHEDRKIERR